MKISKLTEQVSVAYQIEIADIQQLKKAGFLTIINNRPDGEIAGQPSYDEIAKAAQQVGLDTYYIPLSSPNEINNEIIAKTKAALEQANTPVLAYCRTGTRSTILWALAQKGKMSADEIIATALRAGYDIKFLESLLD